MARVSRVKNLQMKAQLSLVRCTKRTRPPSHTPHLPGLHRSRLPHDHTVAPLLQPSLHPTQCTPNRVHLCSPFNAEIRPQHTTHTPCPPPSSVSPVQSHAPYSSSPKLFSRAPQSSSSSRPPSSRKASTSSASACSRRCTSSTPTAQAAPFLRRPHPHRPIPKHLRPEALASTDRLRPLPFSRASCSFASIASRAAIRAA